MLFLQIIIGICFIALVIVLFFEKVDYLYYSMVLVFIGAFISSIFLPEARELDFYILTIDWEIVFFLIGLFLIVEILKEEMVFEEISKLIIDKYHDSPRKMFYVFCIITTLMASFIAAISIVLMFIPLIIIACRKLDLNPTPYLLGISVCINLAATFSPFGSAQNVLIAFEFELNFVWFFINILPYFIITFIITILLLDFFLLNKDVKKFKERQKQCEEDDDCDIHIKHENINLQPVKKNLIVLVVFIVLLILIPQFYVAALLGAIIFVLVNPVKDKEGNKHISISFYLKKVDYKLIFFFMCLFIFVGLLELNGTILIFEKILENLSLENILLLAIIVLITTSVLSGFLDNTPVVIIFIPIIKLLILLPEVHATLLLIAFIIGINLGGNFLPQGSAADLVILDLSKDEGIKDITYMKMFKVGGLFALLHIAIGILYLMLFYFFII
ncbi:MAG: hypothetical protein EU550_03910 [Promethearchaeota archaeon]|nr:MAG: hypothetical protein EU550_03910 [Candidatus Lokiarchaeota archaeon]